MACGPGWGDCRSETPHATRLLFSRGKGGGYKLTREPADYSLGEIVRLVEGRIQPVTCLEECNSRCMQRDSCKTLTMWEELDHLINSFLDDKTLEDLVDGGGPLMSDWPSYL